MTIKDLFQAADETVEATFIIVFFLLLALPILFLAAVSYPLRWAVRNIFTPGRNRD